MSWRKQTNEALFPDILWSRPENRMGAGKVLIIGGNAHAIAAPVKAYSEALEAGAGASRVLLPDHVQKAFGKLVNEGYFAPSNPSGGFAKRALDDWLIHSHWADGVLLAGDFGHNSETSALIESYCSKSPSLLTLTQDAIETTYGFADKLAMRNNTLLVLSFAQAQKLAGALRNPKPLLFSLPLLQVVEILEDLSKRISACLLVRMNKTLIIALRGEVVTTAAPQANEWRVSAAARCAVWWAQNPTKQLESVSSALIDI